MRHVLLAVLVCAVASAPLWADALEDVLALFPESSDVMVPLTEEGKAQLEAAIEALKDALGVPEYLDESSEDEVGRLPVAPEDKHLVNKLSQAYYSYADAFLRDAPVAAQRAAFLKGKQWGFKSLRMNPAFVSFEKQDGFVAAVRQETDVAALFWANGNWLRWAEPDIFAAIRAGIAKKSLAMSERALELDSTYSIYGSYRALAGFWQGMPSDPISAVFTGGLMQDYDKVLYYFCHVVEEPSFCDGVADLIDPISLQYFENRVMFAEYYLMPLGHWEDAKRVLESVLAEPIGEQFPLYNALSHLNAGDLLEKVNEELGL
ncbi:MAG: hypothetical protein JSW65_06170 [Candidatus Bipolaricaulota bacterium]|nr:MAG: hypothetical protein JSW65_06170 [Candidatus Bipolaricaulota bacterium]